MINTFQTQQSEDYDNRQLAKAILHEDFRSFVEVAFKELNPGDAFIPNWHIDAICHAVVETINGERQRLIVSVPPRSLKSIIISVALPAWILGRDTTRRIVCISYGDELVEKHSRDFRKIVTSAWYHVLFPKMRIAKNTASEITTSNGGGRFATSVGGTLTGRGGNLFIIDDPLKPADAMSKAKREKANEWLRTTLASRPDDKRVDKMILVMQRVHVDDPAGILLNTGRWDHLNLPAIAQEPESIPVGHDNHHHRLPGEPLDAIREPLETLEGLKQDMGEMAFSAQYLQAPVPLDGGMIKWSWFQTYEEPPIFRPGDKIIQSWDTAMSNSDNADWSVCTTWHLHNKCYYLLDVQRQRYLFPELCQKAIELYRRYERANLVIEKHGSGISLIQELQHKNIHPISYRPKLDKETRAGQASIEIEKGRVFLPQFAPWLEAFRMEVMAFPKAAHDDQVDSMVQAISWHEARERYPTAAFGVYGDA